jgi:hypothetical protein
MEGIRRGGREREGGGKREKGGERREERGAAHSQQQWDARTTGMWLAGAFGGGGRRGK